MYLNFLLKPLYIVGFLSILCLVALAAFFLTKPNIEPIEWQEREQNWNAANLFYNQYNSERAKKTLSKQLWGLEGSTETEEKAVKWSLIGIVGENDNKLVIIDVESVQEQNSSHKFMRLKEQDSIPSGGIIIEITKDSVIYEVGGEKEEKRLYKSSKLKDGKGSKQ